MGHVSFLVSICSFSDDFLPRLQQVTGTDVGWGWLASLGNIRFRMDSQCTNRLKHQRLKLVGGEISIFRLTHEKIKPTKAATSFLG